MYAKRYMPIIGFLVLSISGAAHNLVLVSKMDSSIVLELRYASVRNFCNENLYDKADAFLIKKAAEALCAVQKELAQEGLGLKIWDAYRPHSVQWKLWNKVPDARYVSDPSKGGRHTRGTAVDVTLIDLKTKAELQMGTDFDDFTEKAWPACVDVPQAVIANRKKLQAVMHKHGFTGIKTEWWHFDYKGWQEYSVLDISFSQLLAVC